MQTAEQYITQNRAVIFDWVVFITSILLGFIFPSLSDFISFSWFSVWMLIAFLLYVAGSWLKHIPLYYRLAHSGKSPKEMPFLFFLIIGHWLIFFIIILVAQPALWKILGSRPVTGNESVSGPFIITAMVLAGLITWLVYRSGKKLKKAAQLSATHLFNRELIADIFLCISISTFTFIFWEKGIMTMFNGKPMENFSAIWGVFVLLSFGFVLFYLPLRYLFLVEDHSSRQTWRRMLYIFGLLVLRSLLIILF